MVPKAERTINTIPTAKKYNPKMKTEYFFNKSFISILNLYLPDLFIFCRYEKDIQRSGFFYQNEMIGIDKLVSK